MKNIINIDWLQVTCLNFPGEFISEFWQKREITTRLFADIYDYVVDEKVMFTALTNPRSSILDKSMCIIKVNNEMLYKSYAVSYLCDLIEYENLKFNNITRLDICADFNTFEEDYNPHQLIVDFQSNTLLKNGRSKYKLIGEQFNKHVYSYLRIGENTSACAAYLYNKSKEMKEVKFKSYIYNSWVANGLEDFDNVWRLEFSIKEFNNVLISKETGEYLKITLDFLKDRSNIIHLYDVMYLKYFDFRINNGGANKSRMERKNLLNVDYVHYTYFIDNEFLNHDRSDKIFIKKLESVNNELRAIKADYLNELKDIQEYIIEKKKLEIWAIEKGFYTAQENVRTSQFYNENEKAQINNLNI